VAYGARLESGLGASPQGFESPILRHCPPGRVGSMAELGPTAAIASSAILTGDVTLGEHAPDTENALLRGRGAEEGRGTLTRSDRLG
jgi:hypothetical protein